MVTRRNHPASICTPKARYFGYGQRCGPVKRGLSLHVSRPYRCGTVPLYALRGHLIGELGGIGIVPSLHAFKFTICIGRAGKRRSTHAWDETVPRSLGEKGLSRFRCRCRQYRQPDRAGLAYAVKAGISQMGFIGRDALAQIKAAGTQSVAMLSFCFKGISSPLMHGKEDHPFDACGWDIIQIGASRSLSRAVRWNRPLSRRTQPFVQQRSSRLADGLGNRDKPRFLCRRTRVGNLCLIPTMERVKEVRPFGRDAPFGAAG